MDFEHIAQTIIDLKNSDLELRDQLIQQGRLGEGYDEAMESLHNTNAKALNEIIENIGYPSVDKVGTEASEAAWLIIQHAIGQPDFMRKCAKLLEHAVGVKKASPLHLAYLTDRIAVFEGKPQRYGTQFDWDENGIMRPQPFDNLSEVNRRRESVGLNTLEKQTEIMRERTKLENQLPPKDFEKRIGEYDQWREKVGWLK